MISSSSSGMTSMRFKVIPRSKQYLAKKWPFVSCVYMEGAGQNSMIFIDRDADLLTFPPRISSPIIRQAAVRMGAALPDDFADDDMFNRRL